VSRNAYAPPTTKTIRSFVKLIGKRKRRWIRLIEVILAGTIQLPPGVENVSILCWYINE
jgi:hypothetical protein